MGWGYGRIKGGKDGKLFFLPSFFFLLSLSFLFFNYFVEIHAFILLTTSSWWKRDGSTSVNLRTCSTDRSKECWRRFAAPLCNTKGALRGEGKASLGAASIVRLRSLVVAPASLSRVCSSLCGPTDTLSGTLEQF